jgi:hypothetical protein
MGSIDVMVLVPGRRPIIKIEREQKNEDQDQNPILENQTCKLKLSEMSHFSAKEYKSYRRCRATVDIRITCCPEQPTAYSIISGFLGLCIVSRRTENKIQQHYGDGSKAMRASYLALKKHYPSKEPHDRINPPVTIVSVSDSDTVLIKVSNA